MNYSPEIAELREDFPWPAEMPDIPYDLQGWCDWSLTEAIQRNIAEVLEKKDFCLYLEIGSWFGCSGKVACEALGQRGYAICCDHWEGSEEMLENRRVCESYHQFMRNLWEFRDMMTPMKLASPGCLGAVKFLGIVPDIIVIDGSHKYQDVAEDIKHSLTLFPTSRIIGHDYDPDWHEVQRAVYDVCVELKLRYLVNKVTWEILK